MASLSPAFIHLDGVRKVYRTRGEEFLAVSDVTMDVREGELVSLVGPSGCGKTTVLRILAGLHPQDGGVVEIGGAGGAFDPGRDVGIVFPATWISRPRRSSANTPGASIICSGWNSPDGPMGRR